MSSKRKADIEAIEEALAGGTTVIEVDNPGTFLPSGPGADVDIVPEETPALTPEQKEANKLLKEANKQIADAGLADLKLQKDQGSLAKAQAQRTIQATKQAIGSLQNGVGSLAIPGGLLLPLVVLGVFLMLLVKVNGNTRLGWLWLVMTGNAEVGSPSAGTSGTGTGGGNPEEDNAGVAKGGGPPPTMHFLPLPLEMDEW